MLGTGRFCSRFSLIAAAFAALVLAAPGLASGQDEPKKPSKEDLQKAKTLAQEGATAESNGELQTAIEKYKEAYGLFPDPNLLIKLGDTYRKNADNGEAVDTWQKYIDSITPLCGKFDEETCTKIDKQNGACVPKYGDPEEEDAEKGPFDSCVGRYMGPVSTRIETVKKEQVEQVEKDKEEAVKIAAEAERKRKAREAAQKVEDDKLPMALNAILMIGADQQVTVVGRLMAGGMLRFGKFAPEAHLAFEGFFRAQDDRGTQGRSFSLDAGARYSLGTEQVVGPFVGFGAGFGFFLGSPREINLKDDSTSCSGQPGNDCTIDVDKQISGRIGFGYGFKSGDKATVAIRIDVGTWWYSVDKTQDLVPVGQIELPQIAHSVLVGIEFMRWR